MKEEDRVYRLEEQQFAKAIKIAKDFHHSWLQGVTFASKILAS
jgi:hypothetical protein